MKSFSSEDHSVKTVSQNVKQLMSVKEKMIFNEDFGF